MHGNANPRYNSAEDYFTALCGVLKKSVWGQAVVNKLIEYLSDQHFITFCSELGGHGCWQLKDTGHSEIKISTELFGLARAFIPIPVVHELTHHHQHIKAIQNKNLALFNDLKYEENSYRYAQFQRIYESHAYAVQFMFAMHHCAALSKNGLARLSAAFPVTTGFVDAEICAEYFHTFSTKTLLQAGRSIFDSMMSREDSLINTYYTKDLLKPLPRTMSVQQAFYECSKAPQSLKEFTPFTTKEVALLLNTYGEMSGLGFEGHLFKETDGPSLESDFYTKPNAYMLAWTNQRKQVAANIKIFGTPTPHFF